MAPVNDCALGPRTQPFARLIRNRLLYDPLGATFFYALKRHQPIPNLRQPAHNATAVSFPRADMA